MSTVVTSTELATLFQQLGWTASQNDLVQAALTAGIPAHVIVLYLQALAASPGGMDDQSIAGVTPAQGTQITTFLKSKGLVGI